MLNASGFYSNIGETLCSLGGLWKISCKSEGDIPLYTVRHLPTLTSEYTRIIKYFLHILFITKGGYSSRVVGCDVGRLLKHPGNPSQFLSGEAKLHPYCVSHHCWIEHQSPWINGQKLCGENILNISGKRLGASRLFFLLPRFSLAEN